MITKKRLNKYIKHNANIISKKKENSLLNKQASYQINTEKYDSFNKQ